MLVVTPRPMATESLMGYVLRLTEANGYPTTSYVLALMNGHWYRAAIGRLDASPLREIAGLAEPEVARLTMCPERRPRAYTRVCGQDLPSYEVVARWPKICPSCLAENGYCEAFWDLAQAIACPIHQTRLVTHCPQCGEKLTWTRAKVTECRCGADLTQLPTEPASPAVSQLMAVMRYLLYCDNYPVPCPRGLHHLVSLDVRRLCKLLWVLTSTLRRHQGGDGMPKARSLYVAQLEQVATALTDWPRSFQNLLSAMYVDDLETAVEQPSFARQFSWLFFRLIKNDAADGRAYAFLEQEAYRFGAGYWTRGAMTRKEGSQHLIPETLRWGTVGEAAKILGFHMVSMKKRIERGEIPTRRISSKKVRDIVVDLDWVRHQQVSQHPPVKIREAAKRVGVSIETLKAMRENGLYEARYRPSQIGSLSREDLDALAERLRALIAAQKSARGRKVITLERAFVRYGASPEEKAALIARLLDNPQWIVGCESPGARVGQAQVMPMTMDAFFRDKRPNPCVTAQAATKRLQCTAAVVTSLRKAGHIQSRQSRGRWLLCGMSLQQFEDTYEIMGAVAKRVGVSIKRAYARTDFSVFRHIKVVSPRHTTIFVHKGDMDEIERTLAGLKE